MTELPELIQALLEPRAYPEPTQGVELVQTQMSFLLMTDGYVYKVKKAVNLGYLDYTTLKKRRFYCQKEIELNRRLCPDVYLGVVPVTRHQGEFVVGGQGKAMEYAVKMRRLPRQRMMDALLKRNRVAPEMLTDLARKLAEFHQRAETNESISAFGRLSAITRNTEENFDQTDRYIGKTISSRKYRQIREYTRSFLGEKAALFQKRVGEGRIRDCHGDLHAAHVCFADGICIYDCIEFNDRFRYGDVAAEVAFLAMDLDHYGRADLSRTFAGAYVALSRDRELPKLLKFYKCYRAYVRGKVESFKLSDPYITPDEKKEILERASGYFELAHSYVKTRPDLFITTGLVGSGKTTLARALAGRLGLVVITSDVTRKKLAGIAETEHRFEEFNSGIYSPEFSKMTYDTMFSEARRILSEGSSVVMDASFTKADWRLGAKRLAEEAGARFFVLECTLDERLIRKRLGRRLEAGSVSDGRWEIYGPQKQNFQPVVEIPTPSHVIIDTSQPISKNIRRVLEKVNAC